MYQETTAISDEVRGFLDKSLFAQPAEQPRSERQRLRLADVLGADREPRSRSPLGPHRRGVRRGPAPHRADGGRLRQRLSGQQPVGHAPDPVPEGRGDREALRAEQRGVQPALGRISVASDADIRNYYTKQFSDLIQNDHVAGLMTSYNAINGTPGAVNTYTVNDLAQRTYGFSGYIDLRLRRGRTAPGTARRAGTCGRRRAGRQRPRATRSCGPTPPPARRSPAPRADWPTRCARARSSCCTGTRPR